MLSAVSRTGFKPALSLLLSFGLALPLAPVAAAQGAANAAVDASAAGVSEARDSLEALASLLDPTEYDVAELALDLAFEEPEFISSWVADNLSYQVYPGLLRGPQGTLVAGAGNALDQSVLLARLLGDAGFDARVVLGELSDEDAPTLVMSMFDDLIDGSTSNEGVQSLDEDGLARLAAATSTDPAAIAAVAEEFVEMELQDVPGFHDALAQTQAILAEMERPLETVATHDLMAEAKQYAWVEYRLGEDESWEAAHPVWPSATPPAVTGVQVLDAEVPPELLHHLRIEVTVERKRGDEFETAELMAPWQRPVANLLGYPIVIGNTALDASGAADLAEMGAEMANSAFYAPVLNGALAPGAMAFDLAGNLVPPDAAMSAMAGVFQTGAARMGDAIGALGAMGSDEPAEEPFALTAQWVDFVLVAPGGEETRHRRTVFDRRPPEARVADTGELLDESVLLENLISTYTVMTTGGGISAAYLASQLYEQAEFSLDVMDSLAALRTSGAEVNEAVSLLEALADYVPKDHLKLFAASDAVDHVLRGAAYRAEPSVVALVGRMTPTADARISSGVDIIANAKRTVHVVDGEILYDVEGGVLAGAWDTVVERELIAATAQVADNALSQGGSNAWTLITHEDRDVLSARAVPVHALTAVRNDLSNGYAVVVPDAGTLGLAMATSEDWSYWRVDLATGETLGMNAAGHGAALTEYQVNLIVGLTVNGALAVPGIAMCAGSGASWQCYCDVIASGVIMSFGGAIFSKLVAAEWALATYAIVDIGIVGPVTTVFWTPPVCSSWAGFGSNPDRAGRGAGTACWAA